MNAAAAFSRDFQPLKAFFPIFFTFLPGVKAFGFAHFRKALPLMLSMPFPPETAEKWKA